MDHEAIGVLFRGSERLIVVSAAFSAIWLGYRLFDRVVSDRGAFEGHIGEWKIKMQRIAPGVLFALFGAGVLIYALRSPLTIPPSSAPQSKQNGGMIFNQPPPPGALVDADRELFMAISSSVVILGKQSLVAKFDDGDRTLASMAVPRLLAYRDALIERIYGEGWASKYYEIAEKASDPAYLDRMSPDDVRKFKEIQAVMTLK
jgi:hypothetical protein